MSEKIENNISDNSETFYDENIKNLPNVDLLPYACYVDDKTILTENGELLQIIKIPSFIDIKGEANSYKLREELNQIFIDNSDNKNLNFWFQTVRKRANLTPRNQQYDNYIAQNFVDKWNNFFDWKHQYANEIYISIVICPQEGKISKIFDLFKALSFSTIKKSKIKELREMLKMVNKCSNDFLNKLKQYEAKILTIFKKDDIYYSEHLSFFNLIINNEQKDIKLPINDLRESILNKKIFFNMNNCLAINNYEKYYYSVISIKACNKLLLSQLDKIIQLNQEILLTQIVSFVDSRNMKDTIEEKTQKLSVNEDFLVYNLSGYGEILEGIEKGLYCNCVSQLIIQLKGKTENELDENIKNFFKTTRKIGLVAVREEMFMPTLFWSQLPAGFNFIKRANLIPYDNVCSYTSLYNFPIGKITDNYWGDCLGVLKSALDTPYFLPLHIEKNGNFLIAGAKSFKKTKFLNFLIILALKQCKKIYYIDCTNRSNSFINSIGGDYYFITKRQAKNRLILNPFSMEKNKQNTDFIISWLKNIIFEEDIGMIKLEDNSSIIEQEWKILLEEINNNINSIKLIGEVFDIAKNKGLTNIKRILSIWCDNEKYGMIFNQEDDIFKTNKNNVMGLNLSCTINNDRLKSSITDYILYRINEVSDKKNTILAIDEAWIILDNKTIGPKFVNIMQNLYNNNVACMFTTSGSQSYEASNIKGSIKNIFSTQILLPNLKSTVYQKKVFAISEEEARVISVMRDEKGTFLLKNGKNVLISSFDFSFLDNEEQLLLQGNSITNNAMKKAKTLINSELPKDWIPVFYLIIKEYNKKKNEQKMKEREKRQIKWEEAKQKSNSNNTILNAE